MHTEKLSLQTPKLLCSSACNTDIRTELWIQRENAVAKTFVLQAGFWVQLNACFFYSTSVSNPLNSIYFNFKKDKIPHLFALHS